MTTENGSAISVLAFVFTVTALLLNIFTIIDAARKISNKSSTKKLKRNGYIVIGTILLLSIIGLVFPLHLKALNLKFNNITSMIILPFFFNIIYCYLLSSELNNNNELSIKKYFSKLKEYIVNILIGKIVFITAVIFLAFSIVWVLCNLGDFKGTTFGAKVTDFTNVVASQIKYYDEKYEENRPENFSIENTVESELYHIKKEVSKDPSEVDKLWKTSIGTDRSVFEDENTFTFYYIKTKAMDDFKNKYGISISVYDGLSRTSYENKICILKVYDSMYEKSYYYKYDIEQCKILESFENKSTADNMINQCKSNL